jgi:methylated-DNA-[protein]-cysteine S-methyltransferase
MLYQSPIGPITLTFDGEALTGLCFGSRVSGNSVVAAENLEKTRRWLDIYFSGRQPDFLPPIKLAGTDFQQCVWRELLTIPYGKTITYGELSRRIGCRSAQAVGGAVGHNPVAIMAPCHRVIGSDGSLTGYAYGLDRKQYLLQLENNNQSL